MTDPETEYIEFLCNKPRKLGTRFYDKDYLEPEGEENIEVNYETECCHQHGQGKFTLHFGRISNDDDEDCGASDKAIRERCKNFWEFIDSEPTLSDLIKNGAFTYSSRPKANTGCVGVCVCDKKDGVIDPNDCSYDPCWYKYLQQVQADRQKERQILAVRHVKTKKLQEKSGQKTGFTCIKTPRKPKDLLSDMTGENLDAELASLREYDEEVKMKLLHYCRWSMDEEEAGEGDEVARADITRDTIHRQSLTKEYLDTLDQADE